MSLLSHIDIYSLCSISRDRCHYLLRRVVPNLDEQDCEVVDEDEGGGEAVRELDDVVVGHPAPLLAGDDLDRVEEPQVMSRIFVSRLSRKSGIKVERTYLDGVE